MQCIASCYFAYVAMGEKINLGKNSPMRQNGMQMYVNAVCVHHHTARFSHKNAVLMPSRVSHVSPLIQVIMELFKILPLKFSSSLCQWQCQSQSQSPSAGTSPRVPVPVPVPESQCRYQSQCWYQWIDPSLCCSSVPNCSCCHTLDPFLEKMEPTDCSMPMMHTAIMLI